MKKKCIVILTNLLGGIGGDGGGGWGGSVKGLPPPHVFVDKHLKI